MMLIGMVFGALGLIQPAGNNAASSLMWMLLSGILLGLFLGPLAARTQATRRQHMLIWTAVIFCNMGAVALEGAFFAPDLVPIPIPVLAIQMCFAALVVSSLITMLFAGREQSAAMVESLRQRSWFAWTWRFLLASASYLVFYWVFGALNYNLVTEPYYTAHAGGLDAPVTATVLKVELIRAPLLVLSVLLFILASHRTRRNLVIVTGLMLFWVGGVVPLVLQVNTLPLPLLLASAVEIFLQNFLTGVVTAYLFWTSYSFTRLVMSGERQIRPATT